MTEDKIRNKGVVTAVTEIKEHEGNKNIGFKISGFQEWFNAYGDGAKLNVVKTLVVKGAEISFKVEAGAAIDFQIIKEAPKESKNWKDDMTNFDELLSDAHEKFKDQFNIKTELVSVDFEKKQAIFSAAVSIEYSKTKIRVFTGHGDAEGISSDMIKPHFMRMAETRAIARALRWATNNAKVAEEETSEAEKE